MSEHVEELASHIKKLNRVISFYENKVSDLSKKVSDQAEMILWLSNKHEGFYKTEAWLELRIRVLDCYGSRCMCCNISPPEAVIHVDHIKPISLYPELSLEFDNLQVLCESCNRGKSNKTMTDYRPKKKPQKTASTDFNSILIGGAA